METQKEILIFFSDQHSGRIAGYMGDPVVRTPNLDRIAAAGTVWENAYTACALCVPARMAFLSGALPTQTGVFNNSGSLDSNRATLMDSLAAAGYDTVLCGRMHFNGIDQRHGFTRRIAGDITPIYDGAKSGFAQELGAFCSTLNENGCTRVIGGGNGPTQEYDRYVVKHALEYLQGSYARPQCVVVGTYCPHFTYVAPKALYEYYLERVGVPDEAVHCAYPLSMFSTRFHDDDPQVVRAARAAYYALIEFEDQLVGQVYDAYQAYLKRTGREGVFIYLSDHGDLAGERGGMYGKKAMFENSVRIPVIFQGAGIRPGVRVREPASIIDVAPTLIELAGTAQLPQTDGASRLGAMRGQPCGEREPVYCEYIEQTPLGKKPCRMVRQGRYKYITYYGFEDEDLLFDLEEDFWETRNLIDTLPGEAARMRALACRGWDPEKILERDAQRSAHLALIGAKNRVHEMELDQSERWQTPQEATRPIPDAVWSKKAGKIQ